MKPLRLLWRLVFGLVRLNNLAMINFATLSVLCTLFANIRVKSVVMGHLTMLVHSLAYCILHLPLWSYMGKLYQWHVLKCLLLIRFRYAWLPRVEYRSEYVYILYVSDYSNRVRMFLVRRWLSVRVRTYLVRRWLLGSGAYVSCT